MIMFCYCPYSIWNGLSNKDEIVNSDMKIMIKSHYPQIQSYLSEFLNLHNLNHKIS